jgi:hypothetical protein
MNRKQVFTGLGLIMVMAGLLLSPCWSPSWADEIVLKEQRVHTGTVLEEDEQTVTLQDRIERLEGDREQGKEAVESSVQGTEKNLKTHDELLQEEMGRVEGVIAWQSKPLNNGRVKIVLQKYTGFSIASLKMIFAEDKKKASEQRVTFEAQTDSQGRYSFARVPPGFYRLYWQPDVETGWVRRLREKPDFEVLPGMLTVQNIPGKKARGKGI